MPTDRSKAEIIISDKGRQVGLFDGLSNLATGLGGVKDKSMHNTWSHSGKNYDHVTLSARFREDWLSQKVVKVVPQDMTREWRKCKTQDACDADKHFDLDRIFRMAYQWARLYGTSFILIDVNDGRDVDKPINWNKLKGRKGCIKSFTVVDRTRVVALGKIDEQPLSPRFGEPNHYQFVNSTKPIHRDRIIRFEGTELPTYERQRNLWYSDSVLIPLMPQIDNFHTTSFAAAQMVQEANTDIIKVDGLANILADPEGSAAMLSRFTDWKQIKSVFGVSILDGREEYDQKSIQLSGVKDLIWEYLRMVAASVGIPATRFLSASPDGMNATGESDLVNYVEFLSGLQKDVFEPRLKVVDKLLAMHFELPEEDFEYEWNCIFPESIAEKATRQKEESEAIVNLVTAGILSRESGLEEAKSKGLVNEDAKVGEDPAKQTNQGAEK